MASGHTTGAVDRNLWISIGQVLTTYRLLHFVYMLYST